MADWTLAIIESPYAGDVRRNVAYARLAMWWCMQNGIAPFASHLLYTQCLDDQDAAERDLGMGAGMAWRRGATITIVFNDFGVSRGMKAGVAHAHKHGHEVREVSLREAMGNGPFVNALVRFEAMDHRPTIDHPEPERASDPRQMRIEDVAPRGDGGPQIGGA